MTASGRRNCVVYLRCWHFNGYTKNCIDEVESLQCMLAKHVISALVQVFSYHLHNSYETICYSNTYTLCVYKYNFMEQPFVVIRNTYVVDIWSTIHSQILSLETVPFIFQERASSTMPSINNFTRVTFSFCCIYFLSFFLVFSVFAGNLVHFFSCQRIPSIYL